MNLTYSREDTKQIDTVAEGFFGTANDTNISDGMDYQPEADKNTVDDASYKEVNQMYRESFTNNLSVGASVLDMKTQEVSDKPIYNPQTPEVDYTPYTPPAQEGSPDEPAPEQPTVQSPEKLNVQDNTGFMESSATALKNAPDDITEDELRADPIFQQAGQILARFNKDRLPRDIESSDGTPKGYRDAQKAEYSLQLGSEMLTNIAGINVSGSQRSWGGLVPLVEDALANGDENVLQALYYTMEMYDKKDMSVKGWQRGFKYLLADGTNFFVSPIVGSALQTAGKKSTSQVIKSKLMARLAQLASKPTAQATVEGGAYMFADELERQRVKVASGNAKEIDLAELALMTGIGSLAGYGIVKVPDVAIKNTKSFYKWLKDGIEKAEFTAPNGDPIYGNGGGGKPPESGMDMSPVDPELVKSATEGNPESQDALAGAVFERNFERVIGENTEGELQPMMLEKLKENPDLVEDLAKKYGFEFEYFTANPDNVGNEVGGKKVQMPPQGNRKLKKQGYEDGTIWVYDPTDTHGAFADPEYTKAWRQVHELSHAITEKYMQNKYGDSRRFGAMSFDRKNPYDESDTRTYKGLSLAEAQRAIEWEDTAFRTQVELLKDMGIPVNEKQARDDWNIASSDTLVRALTGDFTDPAQLGVKLQGDDADKIETKDALQFLENQEKANAEFQGREPTVGTPMDGWEHISDAELRSNIDNFRPEKVGDTVTVSVESMPSEKTTGWGIKQMLNENPELSKEYHDEIMKVTDKIFEDSPLEVTNKGSDTQGAWEGASNLVTQYEIKIPKGGTTPQFQADLQETAMKLARELEQDGIGWHIPSHVDTPVGEVSPVLNAVEVAGGSKLSAEDMLGLDTHLRENYGDTFFLASTEDGVRVVDFTDGNGYNRGSELSQVTNDYFDNLDDSYTASQFNATSNVATPNWESTNNGMQTNGSRPERPSDLHGKDGDNEYRSATRKIQAKVRNNAKVDGVLEEAKGLSGKQLNNKLNSLDMRTLTPTNKQKVIDFRQSNTQPKQKSPKAKKAIKVNENFNDNIYSLVANEIAHLDSNKVYKPAELSKIFANATDNEMVGSGIKGLIESNPDGLMGQALQDAITARPDTLNKVEYVGDGKGEALDLSEFTEQYVEVGEWENTPNWVESESGTGLRIYDDYGQDVSYVHNVYDDDRYVDADGDDVGDWSDMRDKWYHDDYSNEYDDDLIQAIRDGDVNLEDDSIIDVAKATDTEISDQIDNEDFIDQDTVKEFILDKADDESPWYETYNTKVQYKVDNESPLFDTEEDAIDYATDTFHEMYVERFGEDGESNLHEKYSIDGGEDYTVDIFEMPNMEHAGGKAEYFEQHWEHTEQGGKNVAVHTRKKTRTDEDGTVGIVSEEIQSQARQTFDEGGGRGEQVSDERKVAIDNEVDTLKAEGVTADEANKPNLDALAKLRNENIATRERIRLEIQPELDKIRELETKYSNERKQAKIGHVDLLNNPDASPETIALNEAKMADLHRKEFQMMDDYDDLRDSINNHPDVVKIRDEIKPFMMKDSEHQVKMSGIHDKLYKLDQEKAGTKPSVYNEPPMEAKNYEKMVTYDNISSAIDEGAEFYGSNNGQTSNGWDVSSKDEIGGMVEAYNHRIPKLMETITGEKPYVAYYSGNQAEPENRKYWVPQKDVPQTLKSKKGNPLSNYSELYNEAPLDWYWRVDLTDEVKAKLKDAKMELYGVGAGTVLLTNQDDKEEL